MKMIKQTIKSLLLAAMLLPAGGQLQAQVTIGSNIKPSRAVLLELKTRQGAAGTVSSVSDEDNITSGLGDGGLLLPRVKLVSISTLEPFIPDNDPDFLSNADNMKERLAGLMVYNITNNAGTLYPAVYSWNGVNWVTSQANDAVSSILPGGQPKAFSFYESGLGTVDELELKVDGLGTWTYQWYQITGNNVHVRIGKPVGETGTIYPTNAAAVAAGAKTSKFRPQAILQGTTRNANNTGFYKFYCIAESSLGAKLISDIAEVAVGCGAKDNLGEWISFMCFNLGATKLTINDQIAHGMTFSPANDTDGRHYYIANEEQLYGDLYQWGRIGDGHEKRGQGLQGGFIPGSKNPGTNQVAYNVTTPPTYEDGNLIGPTHRYPWRQIARTDATYYGNFITTGAAQGYNWAFNLPAHQIDQLWRAGRLASNDPCAKIKEDGLLYETYYPAQDGISGANTNWRMPSHDEWSGIFKGGNISSAVATATANTWVWNNSNGRGFGIYPAGEKDQNGNPLPCTLFLPASGRRYYNNGALYYQGTYGHYWSSSVVSTSAYSLNFNRNTITPVMGYNRGYGFALRCVKN